jgi:hypothetical protein
MRIMRLKDAHPSAKVKLWCEDRLGLKPIVRKVWSPVKPPLLYASAAQRKPELPVELSGVLELRAATL